MTKDSTQMLIWAGIGVALWYFWNNRQVSAEANPQPEYYDYY